MYLSSFMQNALRLIKSCYFEPDVEKSNSCVKFVSEKETDYCKFRYIIPEILTKYDRSDSFMSDLSYTSFDKKVFEE